MTTIVICGDEIASDSQGTGGVEGVNLSKSKLRRINNSWFGFTGTDCQVLIFEEIIKGECKNIPDELDLMALELPDRGLPKAWYIQKGRLLEDSLPKTGFHSCGSGSKYALGALEMGADARTAVQIAKKRCPYTGGKIVVKKKGQDK